jgi:ParB family chromosome partitioning protein
MIKFKQIKRIKLNEIDTGDETFSVNFMPNLGNLRYSIEKIGLIQPVILRKKLNRYQIICGFRRVSILRDLGSDEIEAIICEEELNDKDFFIISIHDNLLGRGFNVVEKAIAIEKLVYRFKVDSTTVIHEFLPLLSLETSEKILNTYLSLAQMEEEVKIYVINEKVSHSNIRRLATFNQEDRRALIPFISRLKLGENRLKEMLIFLSEISMRDRISIKEILKKPEIETIISQSELTSSQKTEKIKRILMNLRFPKLFQKEEEFEKRIKCLNLPSGISIQHSPYFEGREFKISFQFETPDEYDSFINTLLILKNNEEFKEMMRKFE